jgi:hypothetical protein
MAMPLFKSPHSNRKLTEDSMRPPARMAIARKGLNFCLPAPIKAEGSGQAQQDRIPTCFASISPSKGFLVKRQKPHDSPYAPDSTVNIFPLNLTQSPIAA